MLKHLNNKSIKPNRVVILGAGGFVSGEVENILIKLKIQVLALSRKDLDLTSAHASSSLEKILLPSDSVFFAAAKAPVKNESMFVENMIIGKTVSETINKINVTHLVYLSSDAVYADSRKPLNEDSFCQPNSLHGAMHFSRELFLKNINSSPVCHVRPTLIYGANDPHNGYGPNRFNKLAKSSKDIVLFGRGEEKRDHIHVRSVAELVSLVLLYKSKGVLNAASGKVISFKEIAEIIIKKYGNISKISYTPRIGEMPHNGFRPFDTSEISRSFPNFKNSYIDSWDCKS